MMERYCTAERLTGQPQTIAMTEMEHCFIEDTADNINICTEVS